MARRLEDQIDIHQMQVCDPARTAEHFDPVLFMGVFYRLRCPMLGLDIVAQRVQPQSWRSRGDAAFQRDANRQ